MTTQKHHNSEGFTVWETSRQLGNSMNSNSMNSSPVLVAKPREQAPNFLRTQYELEGLGQAVNIVEKLAAERSPYQGAFREAATAIKDQIGMIEAEMETWTRLQHDGVDLVPLKNITILGGSDSPLPDRRVVVLEA